MNSVVGSRSGGSGGPILSPGLLPGSCGHTEALPMAAETSDRSLFGLGLRPVIWADEVRNVPSQHIFVHSEGI
jgi:hypothetical protein